MLHLVALVVNLRLSRQNYPYYRMEDLSQLSEAQRLALDKLTALVGIDQINPIMTQGPKVLQHALRPLCAMRQR